MSAPREPIDRLVAVADDAARCGARRPSMSTISFCARLVSWNSSTRMCLKRCGSVEHIRRALEQSHGEQQQVVEVHGRGGEEPLLVFLVDVGDAPLEDRAGPLGVGGGAGQLVLGRRDGGVDAAGGKLLGVEVQSRRMCSTRSPAVGVVVDGEGLAVPEPVGVRAAGCARRRRGTSRPTCARRRRRSAPRPGARISSAALLVKVMARISHGRDVAGGDQMGDAVGEHPRLARPRPRHHQQRAAAVDARHGAGDR